MTLWITLAILVAGLPTLLMALVRLAGAFGPKAEYRTFMVLMFLLMTLFAQLWLKWISTRFALLKYGIPEVALLFVAMIVGLVTVVLYRHRPAVTRFVSVLSWCALAVPIVFVCSPQRPAIASSSRLVVSMRRSASCIHKTVMASRRRWSELKWLACSTQSSVTLERGT